jgi:hypothetical protein
VLNCPKFLTTSEYAPRLRARLETERCSFKMRDNGAGKGRLSGIKLVVDVSSNCRQRLRQTAAAIPVMMACHGPRSCQEGNRVPSKPFE